MATLLHSTQATPGSTLNGTLSVTIPATTLGSMLVVVVEIDNATTDGHVSGITLGGSALNFARDVNAPGNDTIEIWSNYNTPAGQTAIAISTAGGAGAQGTTATVYEYSGFSGAASSFDKSSTFTGLGTSTSWSSGSTGTLSQAAELAIGAAAMAVTITGPASPWTNLTQTADGQGSNVITGWQIVAATTALAYAGTVSPTHISVAAIATYKVAAALAVTTSSLPGGTTGVAYSTNLAASGGSGVGQTWSLNTGSLPTGMSLSSAGVLSGTPHTAGTSAAFTVKVTDNVGNSAISGSLTLTVTSNLTVTTTSLPPCHAGVSYSQSVAASGGFGAYTWAKTAGTLPTGLSLSSAGVVSGTPSGSPGVYSFTAQVTDAGTNTASASVTIALVSPPATALNNAEGGTTAGTTVTTGNSGGASGQAFDSVTIGTGAALTFDTNSAHGGFAYKFSTAGTSAVSQVAWTTAIGESVQAWFRAYVYFPTLPAANTRIVDADSGGSGAAVLSVTTTGQLHWLTGAAGTTQVSTQTAITAGQWFRVEGYVLGDPANGAVELKLFVGDNVNGTEPDEVQTLTGLNTTGALDHYYFGITFNATNAGPYWLDDLGWSSVGYIGPVLPNSVPFPKGNIGGKVEILVNGAWTNITPYVRQDAGIAITRGRQDEASTVQASSAVMTLDNADKRFTTENASGPYYPFLGRNTPIRISVSAATVSGVPYSGFRFYGEVPSWPPVADVTQQSLNVVISAFGIWRRLQQNTKNAGSALYRYYTKLTGSGVPVAAWPGEDPTGSTQIASAVPGGQAMTWTGAPTLSADTSFPGSDAFFQLNGAVLTGTVGTSGVTPSPAIFQTPGTWPWTCPGDVTSLTSAEFWAGGGGGGWGPGTNFGKAGGAGGEYAKESSVAVTPGTTYMINVGAGGVGGSNSGSATWGGDSFAIFDAVEVYANGGAAGANIYAGSGGTGSTNTVHHNGGDGGNSNATGGGGGGSSAGTAAAGNTGGVSNSNLGAPGGAAVTGGGPGGSGNSAGNDGLMPVSGPGGGGGGAGISANNGGNGYAGQARLTYTTGAAPAANVLRFLLDVPSSGGTNGAILAQLIGAGTIQKVTVTYNTGGTLTVAGFNSGGTQKFTTTTAVGFNGVPVMISVELTQSGSSVAWAVRYMKVTDSASTTSGSGTVASSTVGQASQVTLNVGGTETQAVGIGWVTVQNAVIPLSNLVGPLSAYNGEYALARFARLCGEESIGFAAPWSYDALVAAQAPAGWWKLNQDATDASGGGHNGTATAVTYTNVGPPAYNPAQGWAGIFNGSTSNITTTYVPPALSAVTVAFWVNLNGQAQTNSFPQIVASSDASSTHKGWQIYYDNTSGGVLGANLGNGTTWHEDGQTVNGLPANGWTHVVFVYDGTNGRFYTNGVDNGVWTNFTGSITADTGGVKIGDSFGGGNQFKGQLAEVAVFARALTAAQILALYQANAGSALGVQTDEPISTLLQECEDVDRGLIYEPRNVLGLAYRTRASMTNQLPVVIDFNAGIVSDPMPTPIADDQYTHNDITLSRNGGSSAEAVLSSGAMSVQAPPNGVGTYAYTNTYNFYADWQLAAAALWALTLGTVAALRWPIISFDLANKSAGAEFASLPGLDSGDYLQLTTPPAWAVASVVKQLMFGFTETISEFAFMIAVNAVPESPYEGLGLPTW